MRLLEKKLALDAVIGVLGVVAIPYLGGGVTVPGSKEAGCLSMAAIFAAVGVLSGRRLRGGNRKGCNVRLLTFAPAAGLLSPATPAFMVRALLCLVSRSLCMDSVSVADGV